MAEAKQETGLQPWTADEAVQAVDFYRRYHAAESARDKLTVAEPLLKLDMIRSIDTIDGGRLQRWVVRVPILPRHQYLVPGRSVAPDDLPPDMRESWPSGKQRWGKLYSAGIKAEGFYHLNKVAGVRFYTPPYVHNRAGQEVPNPIHSRDYLYHRELAITYSETGQMLAEIEDIELDFQMAWEAVRLAKLKVLLPKAQKKGREAPDDEEFVDSTTGETVTGASAPLASGKSVV